MGLLPSMLMGKMLNGTQYQLSQYVQAIGAMVCVTIMHLSEEHKESGKGGKGKVSENDDMSEALKGLCGITLLIMFFACDSFTSQWQTGLYKKYPDLTKTQMMLSGNLTGLSITLLS